MMTVLIKLRMAINMFAIFRKEIFTFPESVDHSIAFVRNLTQVLHLGRQRCRPFEVKHHHHHWNIIIIIGTPFSSLEHLYHHWNIIIITGTSSSSLSSMEHHHNHWNIIITIIIFQATGAGCGLSCISYFYW